MSETTKYRRLAFNSILFAIGNFGSKLISFFMLPIYTSYMSQSAYGFSDLVMTTVSLLLPIFSLSVFDAVLRYGMNSEISKDKVLFNGFMITNIGSALLMITAPIFVLLDVKLSLFTILIVVANLYQSLFSQFSKINNQVKLFALNGMLLTFCTAILNVFFLVYLKLGLEGFLISNFLAIFISNVYLSFRIKLISRLKSQSFNLILTKEMLKYSIPLIPNSIALWVSNIANRYFILFFLGSAANGVFAISNKIPSLLGVINGIFFQAWQMSAIEEYNSEDEGTFYSTTFRVYSKLLFITTCLIILVAQPLTKYLVSSDFYNSWIYVPILLLTIVFSSFSGFLGQFYIAAMDTNGVFYTTIIGSAINIVLNLLLIPLFGLYGAGISSAVSFFVLWIYRVLDTKKYIYITYDIKNLCLNIGLIIFQIALLLLTNTLILLYFVQLLVLIIILWINREIIILIAKKAIRKK